MDAGGIEPVGRLVEDQELGVGEKTAGNAESLAHAQRVALHALVGALREADACERAVDPAMRFPLARCRDHDQVLATSQVPVEAGLLDDRADSRQCRRPLLWDRTAEQLHRAGRRVRETEQHPDQSGLPGAVRAQVAEGGSPRDAQVHICDRGAVAEALCETGSLDDECLCAHATRVGVRLHVVFGRDGDSISSSRTMCGSFARPRRHDGIRSTFRP